jgi:hypothetical protein
MKSEREKMAAGEWYRCLDLELHAMRERARNAVHQHNTMAPDERGRMAPALEALFAAAAQDVFIEAPFHCSYGVNITLGSRRLPQRRLHYTRQCPGRHRRWVDTGPGRPNLLRRAPQGCRATPRRPRDRPARDDRQGRLDRRRGDHFGRCCDRRWRNCRRRRRGDAGCGSRRNGGGESSAGDCGALAGCCPRFPARTFQLHRFRVNHSSPIFSAAINASCGISTLPNWRMRFLPAFCFSRSLRLRVASPP